MHSVLCNITHHSVLYKIYHSIIKYRESTSINAYRKVKVSEQKTEEVTNGEVQRGTANGQD